MVGRALSLCKLVKIVLKYLKNVKNHANDKMFHGNFFSSNFSYKVAICENVRAKAAQGLSQL